MIQTLKDNMVSLPIQKLLEINNNNERKSLVECFDKKKKSFSKSHMHPIFPIGGQRYFNISFTYRAYLIWNLPSMNHRKNTLKLNETLCSSLS